jgi:hypothetical protein
MLDLYLIGRQSLGFSARTIRFEFGAMGGAWQMNNPQQSNEANLHTGENRRPILGRRRQIDESTRSRILRNKNTSNRTEDRVLSME